MYHLVPILPKKTKRRSAKHFLLHHSCPTSPLTPHLIYYNIGSNNHYNIAFIDQLSQTTRVFFFAHDLFFDVLSYNITLSLSTFEYPRNMLAPDSQHHVAINTALTYPQNSPHQSKRNKQTSSYNYNSGNSATVLLLI